MRGNSLNYDLCDLSDFYDFLFPPFGRNGGLFFLFLRIYLFIHFFCLALFDVYLCDCLFSVGRCPTLNYYALSGRPQGFAPTFRAFQTSPLPPFKGGIFVPSCFRAFAPSITYDKNYKSYLPSPLRLSFPNLLFLYF